MHEELDTFEVLKALIPFKELNWEALDELAPQVEIREYPEGTYVFRRGSASLGLLFIVLDGLAEVTLNNDRGVETVVGYRRRSDMFGETVVLTGGNYSGNVRVKEA
ncbi:MAG: cyclic nucleotide-binding domain-containing protein, partial [Bacillota bacterium]|nr:cyclic nucleotide-binding domain-containing protein [Bacillota bacterium]